MGDTWTSAKLFVGTVLLCGLTGGGLCDRPSPAPAGGAPVAGTTPGSAHDPKFSDKTLWPNLTGKEYFLKEQWPKARLLVWAHPGQGGGGRAGRGALDVTDPKNWLEDGKPCQKLVLDENTDLLLPAATTPYSLGFRDSDMLEVLRHITIEDNAGFVGGGDGRGRKIHGNVWIKKGGHMYAQGATAFVGSRHTFMRNDNVDANPTGQRKMDLHRCSQYFTFNKDKGCSVEFLGHVSVLDEFRIFGCTVIVGSDSQLQPGRAASPTISQGGVLALLDGAYFGSWVNNFASPDMQVTGVIQGGLPERPLKRSCTFGLAFKNHSDAAYEAPSARIDRHTSKPEKYARVPSLVLNPGSALRSYSTDAQKAHLVFTYQRDGVGDKEALYLRPMPGSPGEKAELEKNPEAAGRFKWFDSLPRGIDCYLSKDVAVDGVEFDNLRKGGIICQDPSDRAKWKNLFFGPRCLAKGDDLFSRVEKIGKGAQY